MGHQNGKSGITLSDVRKLIDDQRKALNRSLEQLAEFEARLSGAESIGQEMKRVNDAFVAQWQQRYNQRYGYQGAKDATACKRLVQSLAPEEILRRMTVFFANDDPFFAKSRHSLAIFASTINQHVPAVLPLAAADFTCRHQPRCASEVACTTKRLAEANTPS